MTIPGLPPPTVPMLLPSGLINPVWYQYLAALDAKVRSL